MFVHPNLNTELTVNFTNLEDICAATMLEIH
jgi:hypothetical protein